MKQTRLILFVTSVVLLILSFTLSFKADESFSSLTILHTNDTHASLDDVGRRATLIEQIRSSVCKDNVLLVDGGDVSAGSLYFTLAQGQADLWFMQYMGYEAMVTGNHEFDKGPQALANFIDNAAFPVLCANFDFSQEPLLAGKIAPWTIIRKNGEKYGVFGLTAEETNEISNPGVNIAINNAVQSAQQSVAELQKQGINKIIALTHIGWDKDLELAGKVKDIDVIIGGHTHTVPDVYPVVVNASGVPALVVQAGSQGKYLGQLNLTFDRNGIIRNWDVSKLHVIDDAIEAAPVCVDRLAEFQGPLDEMLNIIIGETLVPLDGERNNIRTQETNLGNLIADAFLSQARPLGASLALLNSGMMRSSMPAGKLSLGQILEITPFGNSLTVLKISGKQIITALENGVSQVEQVAGRFPQVAGIRFAWNPQALPGHRIVSVEIKTGNGYQLMDPSAIYGVATNDFLAGGGDGYTVFQKAVNIYNSGLADFEILQDHIKANSPLRPELEGRIQVSRTSFN
jgi:2',3'-cyclic-nucleotide 2'-phosphodiesterase (5'-nucleotidase family)